MWEQTRDGQYWVYIHFKSKFTLISKYDAWQELYIYVEHLSSLGKQYTEPHNMQTCPTRLPLQ